MSAPSRASRGGHYVARGGTAPMTRGTRGGRGSRGSRGGRGANIANAAASQNPKAEAFLQSLRGGRGRRAMERGHTARATSPVDRSAKRNSTYSSAPRSTSPKPPPTSANEFMNQMLEKYNLLKTKRDHERAKAIRDGFLADPEKKTTLDQAITPVGTCTDLCPEFERIQRIVQNAVDRTEKIHHNSLGREMPVEDRMVKRFRRSAAGDDEQLPSDIRTPGTLKRSLDYLIDDVIGNGENLAQVHKFVWDRTRSIRNDFSIQQVSKPEDVRLAVECFERIARFHILSLHQLSNPENLGGGNFDAHQEREQLNNTLLSLMYYYDDHRSRQPFENEAEFRAYCIVLEMQATHPDLEDRMQAWPKELLKATQVRVAFDLHAAASNTLLDQGPLKPATPFLVAQANYEGFWKRMKSLQVPYLLACLAESHFGQIRFLALQNIWKTNKKAPSPVQQKNVSWNLDELTKILAFDDYEQTRDFCENFDIQFKSDGGSLECLDFSSCASDSLSPASTMNRQIFSHDVVENKRFFRTFAAVINGVSVARAIKEGLVEEGSENDEVDEAMEQYEDENSLFIPETKPSLAFNPTAPAFTPTEQAQSVPAVQKPSIFGLSNTSQSTAPSIFGNTKDSTTNGTSFFGKTAGTKSSPFGTSNATATSSSGFGRPNPQKIPAFNISGNSQEPAPSFSSPQIPFSGPKEAQTTSTFVNPFQKAQEPLGTSFIRWGQETSTAQSKPPEPPAQAQPLSTFSWTSKSNAPSIFGTPSHVSEPADQASILPSPAAPVPSPASNLASESFTETQALSSKPPASPRPHHATLAGPSQGGGVLSSDQPLAPSTKDAPLQPPETPRPRILDSPKANQASPFDSTKSIQSPFDFRHPQMSKPAPLLAQTFAPEAAAANAPPPTLNQPVLPTFNFPPQPSNVNSEIVSTPSPFTSSSTDGPPFAEPASTPNASQQANTDKEPGASQSAFSFTPTKPTIPPSFTPVAAPPPRFLSNARPRTSSPLSQPPELVPPSPENSFSERQASRQVPRQASQVNKEVDKGQVVECLARLCMVEEGGLLGQYVEYKAMSIIKAAAIQFEREEEAKEIAVARYQILASKYCRRWRDVTWKKQLSRRAQHRRSVFAQVIREENSKQRRTEEELHAILQASREKQDIQAAQRRNDLGDSLLLSPTPSKRATQIDRPQPVAGKKRKSIQREIPEQNTMRPGSTFTKGHKRTRTADQSNDRRLAQTHAQTPPRHSPDRPFSSSITSSRSVLLDYPDSSVIQAAARSRKVDRTNTDYFRLKARGVDPETTTIPHTRDSLGRKEQNAAEETSEKTPLTWAERRMRASTMSERVNPLLAKALRSKPSQSSSPLPLGASSPRNTSAPKPATPPMTKIAPPPAPTPPSALKDDDDAFLRQIREVRNALSKDEDWFKEHSEQLQEETRRGSDMASRNRTGQQGPPSLSWSPPNLASNPNGYDFAPSASVRVSRSEERLRRTGGYGLANRPVQDYLPGGSRYLPAMSKASAALLRASSATSSNKADAVASTKRRGKRKVADPTYRYDSDLQDDIRQEEQSVSRRKKTKGEDVARARYGDWGGVNQQQRHPSPFGYHNGLSGNGGIDHVDEFTSNQSHDFHQHVEQPQYDPRLVQTNGQFPGADDDKDNVYHQEQANDRGILYHNLSTQSNQDEDDYTGGHGRVYTDQADESAFAKADAAAEDDNSDIDEQASDNTDAYAGIHAVEEDEIQGPSESDESPSLPEEDAGFDEEDEYGDGDDEDDGEQGYEDEDEDEGEEEEEEDDDEEEYQRDEADQQRRSESQGNISGVIAGTGNTEEDALVLSD